VGNRAAQRIILTGGSNRGIRSEPQIQNVVGLVRGADLSAYGGFERHMKSSFGIRIFRESQKLKRIRRCLVEEKYRESCASLWAGVDLWASNHRVHRKRAA
jgi:hypothetical protein